jgi:exodeoxyribonuclease VII small subunit
MVDDSAKQIQDMTFKELLTELEETVLALESNQLELEESIKRYERGVELLRASRQRLEGAQQKVTTLLGELEVESDDSVDTQLS